MYFLFLCIFCEFAMCMFACGIEFRVFANKFAYFIGNFLFVFGSNIYIYLLFLLCHSLKQKIRAPPGGARPSWASLG